MLWSKEIGLRRISNGLSISLRAPGYEPWFAEQWVHIGCSDLTLIVFYRVDVNDTDNIACDAPSGYIASWWRHAMDTLSTLLALCPLIFSKILVEGWEKSMRRDRIRKGADNTQVLYCICSYPEEAVKQTLGLPVIQDIMTLKWRQYYLCYDI